MGNHIWITFVLSLAITIATCQVQTQRPNVGGPSLIAQNTVVEAAPPPKPIAVQVDDTCLQCICHASTECKPLACHNAGPSAYFCGPYLISWAYWADAGKPSDDVNNPYAFEACLSDKGCSETTIRQYMAKHGKDCNGDNQITCADVARIHKGGPGGCSAPWIDNTTYWKAFLTCNLG